MALKSTINFSVQVIGDGADRTVVVDSAAGPFGLQAPAGMDLAPSFSLGSLMPTSVMNIVSGNGHAISGTLVAGVLTLTYGVGDMPGNGEEDIVTGVFGFAG